MWEIIKRKVERFDAESIFVSLLFIRSFKLFHIQEMRHTVLAGLQTRERLTGAVLILELAPVFLVPGHKHPDH